MHEGSKLAEQRMGDSGPSMARSWDNLNQRARTKDRDDVAIQPAIAKLENLDDRMMGFSKVLADFTGRINGFADNLVGAQPEMATKTDGAPIGRPSSCLGRLDQSAYDVNDQLSRLANAIGRLGA